MKPMTTSREPPTPRSYAAPALTKGLEILEVLAGAGAPLTTRELADRLYRSKNEIFRMVVVLVERGYLAREPGTERLVLTRRLFELGIRTPRSRQLVEAAVPEMERLSDEVGQSSHLAVLARGETVVITATSGGSDLSLTLKLGYRRPALLATSGRVLLAFQPPERRARLLAEAVEAGGGRAAPRSLSRELSRIRADGVSLAPSKDTVGVTDIGAPVLAADRSAVASIVIPYLNRHGQPPTNSRARLVTCCDAIAQALR
jgi:DNA-binding IclR family transcriptional regulator